VPATLQALKSHLYFFQITDIRAGGSHASPGRRRSVIVTTIDPMTGNKVTDLEHHPFVVEGSGMATLKNYFESEHNRHACLMAQPNDPDLFEDDFTHHS